MNRAQDNKQSGFTIIEVMIVLAIAGVIMLMVFLAIPALQRNNRNTQRRNDVAAVGGALNEAIVNNNGKLPPAADFRTKVLNNANLGFYATVDVDYGTSTTVAAENPSGKDMIQVRSTAKCSDNNITGGSSRNVAAIYYVETANGYERQCREF